MSVMLPARPEPLSIDPARAALVVVDLQNAYASQGGYLDLAGFDISGEVSVVVRAGVGCGVLAGVKGG